MAAISRTIIKIKQGKEADVEAYIDQKGSEISSIPGIMNWGTIYTDKNELTIIAVYENKESAENATAFVNKVMADFNRIQRLTTQKLNRMKDTGKYHDQIGAFYSPLMRRDQGLPPLDQETLNENIMTRWQKLAGIL